MSPFREQMGASQGGPLGILPRLSQLHSGADIHPRAVEGPGMMGKSVLQQLCKKGNLKTGAWGHGGMGGETFRGCSHFPDLKTLVTC